MASWVVLLDDAYVREHGIVLSGPRTIALRAGATRPRAYLNGGNLVFDAEESQVEGIVEKLRASLEESHGAPVPMIWRSGADVLAATRNSPYASPEGDPTRVRIGFLDEVPEPAQLAALDPARSDSDSFEVHGREVHAKYEGDPGRSTLTPGWFSDTLKAPCVFRHWRTLQQLIQMADPPRMPVQVGPGLRGLSYVMITVSDMERSVAFYRDALGLQVTMETPFWSELNAGGVRIALHGGGEGKVPEGEPAGTASLGFNVPDVDKTHATLAEAGVSFHVEPTTREQEGIRLCSATDPDGVVLHFAQYLAPG